MPPKREQSVMVLALRQVHGATERRDAFCKPEAGAACRVEVEDSGKKQSPLVYARAGGAEQERGFVTVEMLEKAVCRSRIAFGCAATIVVAVGPGSVPSRARSRKVYTNFDLPQCSPDRAERHACGARLGLWAPQLAQLHALHDTGSGFPIVLSLCLTPHNFAMGIEIANKMSNKLQASRLISTITPLLCPQPYATSLPKGTCASSTVCLYRKTSPSLFLQPAYAFMQACRGAWDS